MLLYHVVLPVKYRREIFVTDRIRNGLIKCCHETVSKYEIYFDTIWVDWDHVHFLVQSVPTQSVTDIVSKIKSFTAKVLLKCKVELEWKIWWWEIRTDGYYANTVGTVAGYQSIQNYVVNQGYGRKWYVTLNWGGKQSMKQMMLLKSGA